MMTTMAESLAVEWDYAGICADVILPLGIYQCQDWTRLVGRDELPSAATRAIRGLLATEDSQQKSDSCLNCFVRVHVAPLGIGIGHWRPHPDLPYCIVRYCTATTKFMRHKILHQW